MKTFNLMAVAAGLLLLSAPAALFADDTSDKSADKPGPELRQKLRNMTPEERRQYIKDHPEIAKKLQEARREIFEKNKGALERAGLNQQELQGMEPAARREKIKQAIDARVTDLEKKKTDGTALTEQEQSDLDSLKQLQKMAQNQNGQQRRQPKSTKPKASDNQ